LLLEQVLVRVLVRVLVQVLVQVWVAVWVQELDRTNRNLFIPMSLECWRSWDQLLDCH